MRVLPLAAIQVLSMVVAFITIGTLSLVFWVSAIVFALCCVYIQLEKGRLLREIDEIFGEDSEFV